MQTRRSSRATTPVESTKRKRTISTDYVPNEPPPAAVEAKVQFFTAVAVNDDGTIKQGVKGIETNTISNGYGDTDKGKNNIMSHWLFADDDTVPRPQKMTMSTVTRPGNPTRKSPRLLNKTSKPSPNAISGTALDMLRQTSKVGSAMEKAPTWNDNSSGVSGFTMASGKPCPTIDPDKKVGIRKLLGLDELDGLEADVNIAVGMPVAATSAADTPEIDTTKSNLSASSLAWTETPLRDCSQPTSNAAGDEATDTAGDRTPIASFRESTSLKRGVELKSVERIPVTTSSTHKYVNVPSKKTFTILEMWCRNCVLTNHDGSSLSPAMLSRLWNIYGNPLLVTYSNSEKFTFIHYSPCDASITIGGLNEMQLCFKQMMDHCVEPSAERQRFDDEWLRQKYCLFTATECRRFRRSICKRIRNGGLLKDALLKVQLPNPLNVLRQIVRSFNEEYGGKESILIQILHGDAPANSPVVVTVEVVKGEHIYITDGQSVITAFASDCYMRQLLKTQRIVPGDKIQLHGIVIGTDKERNENAVVQLNFNSISPAPNKPLGLQNRHGNAHIRELKGGAGNVMQLDVTVLGIMPPIFKVYYRELESRVAKSAILNEWDFNAVFADPEYKPPVSIENVYVHHTVSVIDTVILLRIKDYLQDPQKFEKALVKSCALLTLRNVDETLLGMIEPTTRLTVTSLSVKNSVSLNRGNRFAEQGTHIGNCLCFETTLQSRIDVKERDTPLQKIRKTVSDYQNGALKGNADVNDGDQVLGGRKSIFHTLILGEPALSISPHDEDSFIELIRCHTDRMDEHHEELFLDQICSVTGIVVEAGEIINVGKNLRYFRLFMLTTQLKIAVVKVVERVVLLPSHNGQPQNVCVKLERIRRRLLSQRLTIARAPGTTAKKQDSLFVICMNLLYDGFDEVNEVYNFNTTTSRMVVRDCVMLKELHKRLYDGIVFAEGAGYALSYNALKGTGETESDHDCRAYARAVAQAKIKISHLLNRDSEDVALCEEIMVEYQGVPGSKVPLVPMAAITTAR
ncbi:uncharacterized protein BXIN_1061 [Babesia sp. Xinjiang]|uniref:uncharacterized protein n=1 Tax=Babesia sp. Xinjiang TaxID=462227 RepID=UPI000A220759|nr:uncharacterized protein BXIN_1061 [Babesia sp. Xinjiang]ORM41982.1 hypothetical protein BXIN_1061 [Babesia sp. Xinjiang]